MYARFFKRFLDFWLAFVALIVLSPLLLSLTVVGAIAMRGNPFFIQKRPGKINKKTGHERIITLIKFRTMSNRKDSYGFLLPDEQRLNAYGQALRSSSLDELPELLNIIKGDLSICGPRPLLVQYLPRYSERQRRRHEVRPGLTGYAQVNGRNAVTWEEKFEMDVWYIDHISLRVDVGIIIKTVRAVLDRKGISSETSATMEEFSGTASEGEGKV